MANPSSAARMGSSLFTFMASGSGLDWCGFAVDTEEGRVGRFAVEMERVPVVLLKGVRPRRFSTAKQSGRVLSSTNVDSGLPACWSGSSVHAETRAAKAECAVRRLTGTVSCSVKRADSAARLRVAPRAPLLRGWSGRVRQCRCPNGPIPINFDRGATEAAEMRSVDQSGHTESACCLLRWH